MYRKDGVARKLETMVLLLIENDKFLNLIALTNDSGDKARMRAESGEDAAGEWSRHISKGSFGADSNYTCQPGLALERQPHCRYARPSTRSL
jgi:hypothetical protein